MITDFYTTTLTITRETASVLDEQTPSVSIAPDRQPASAGYVELKLAGASGGGIIKIIGTVAGSPDRENVTLDSGDSYGRGLKSFSGITRFETAIASGALSATAVRGSGEPIAKEIIAVTVMGRVTATRTQGKIRVLESGQEVMADYSMAAMSHPGIIAGRNAYAQMRNEPRKKFEIIFVTPMIELGNINAELKLIENSQGP